jgi:hypothetical protein
MSEPDSLDLIWGCKAIAAALGVTERACFHMLESGDLPGAKQIGRRWVVSRKALERFFEGEAA